MCFGVGSIGRTHVSVFQQPLYLRRPCIFIAIDEETARTAVRAENQKQNGNTANFLDGLEFAHWITTIIATIRLWKKSRIRGNGER
jgi:hypothetical protein